MIQISNLTKNFGSKMAVNNLSLEVKKGELFGFLGPNAAGKTTTIKLLAGLLKPTRGSARICGYDIQKDYIKAKSFLSYIPDMPYLYERLTGREFLRFVSEIYLLDEKKTDKKIEDLLETFNIKGYADMLIEEYSHGMRQKLVLSAGLLHDPEVIVVDEPMVGLDPKTSHLVKDIFRKSVQNGTSIFMSTHTLSVAEEVCDRVGIIDNGNLIAIGTIDELRKTSGVDGKLEEIFLKLT
ncbi:MAG: ABC transporter ATP-binding protein [Candidatus Omnitrophica bacterium]|nr:ABC transporter ATP-binding protein [Candidatus Omnitrophota bacterium]